VWMGSHRSFDMTSIQDQDKEALASCDLETH